MKTDNKIRLVWLLVCALAIPVTAAENPPQVKVESGTLEGVYNPATGIAAFKGIPFAAPPVGDLRWQPPQPAADWQGVRQATQFGPRAMQKPIYGDMGFRSDGMSEDSLYLNVWTPVVPGEGKTEQKLPVLVYFYGGGFAAGDGSEGRYDGESMAQRGIVSLTVNYRLGVFGFFAHPALTKESPHKASGNYGLLDQQAALAWVQRNIAAFGGDPNRVTIAGESAGSISVSAHMASPLSKGLIAGAIGESGSIIGAPIPAVPLAEVEAQGVQAAATWGLGKSPSLESLRGLSAQQLLDVTNQQPRFGVTLAVDGYFLSRDPLEVFADGDQAQVPLLAGVNTAESSWRGILGKHEPTVANYRKALEKLYGNKAEEILALYPASNAREVMEAAQALASDRFISYGTWTWASLANATGKKPVYYYVYARPRPPMTAAFSDAEAGLAGGVKRNKQEKQKATKAPPESSSEPLPEPKGAVHSAEIEYAMGNLRLNKVYDWTADDHKVSDIMQTYFANFIKTGNPNGKSLPTWPQFKSGQHIVIDVDTHSASSKTFQQRYEFLDQFYLPNFGDTPSGK